MRECDYSLSMYRRGIAKKILIPNINNYSESRVGYTSIFRRRSKLGVVFDKSGRPKQC